MVFSIYCFWIRKVGGSEIFLEEVPSVHLRRNAFKKAVALIKEINPKDSIVIRKLCPWTLKVVEYTVRYKNG